MALIQPQDDFYVLALPRADEVLLIVKVADTTLRYDREQDPALRPPRHPRGMAHRRGRPDAHGIRDTDGRYRNERRAEPVHILAPKALLGVEVDLSRLFGTA